MEAGCIGERGQPKSTMGMASIGNALPIMNFLVLAPFGETD